MCVVSEVFNKKNQTEEQNCLRKARNNIYQSFYWTKLPSNNVLFIYIQLGCHLLHFFLSSAEPTFSSVAEFFLKHFPHVILYHNVKNFSNKIHPTVDRFRYILLPLYTVFEIQSLPFLSFEFFINTTNLAKHNTPEIAQIHWSNLQLMQ